MSTIKDAKILVVDDNPDNLKLLVRMLKETDYDVRPAINGQTAVISLENYQPDLILLDINMPDMNGYEVAQRVRANPETAEIPIIFISALDDSDSIVNAFEKGGVDYVSKPFQFAEVNARIRTHLTLHFQRQQLLYYHERDKQQLERIRRSEEAYRDLFDNASDIIQSVDETGHFLYVNRVWHETLGYDDVETSQMTFTDIIHQDHINHCVEVFEHVRQNSGTNQLIETIFVTKSGEEMIVQGNVNSVNDPQLGFHTRGIFRDITQQRDAEKQAIQFTLERERQQILSDFIRDTSHELRTPLSIISHQLYFIRRMATDEKQLEKVEFAEAKVKELDNVIGQLHNFVKLTTQRAVDMTQVNVANLIENCITACELYAQQSNISFEFDIAHDIPEIQGNFSLLKQAICELLDNAIRHAEAHSPVRVITKQTEDFVEIRVINYGSDIEAKFRELIFTPMFKINEARTSDGSGIGVGLSMVRQIIDLHDGHVDVLSEQDHITQFRVFIPI